MPPLISIVITTYNREPYLATAIASVLNQTWQDFELLIWDDGSTDGSLALAQSYAKRDHRVRVIAAPHQGRVAALRSALAETRGQYLGWVDSDDWLAPTALADTRAVLATNPDLGFVYTHYLDTNAEGQVTGYGHRCVIPYSPERLLLDFMTFHFRLIRRSTFEQVGGIDDSLDYVEDYDLCLRLSEVAGVACVEKPLYYYRHHGANASQEWQIEQTLRAQTVIQRSLERRGLGDRWAVQVTLPEGRFCLQRKSPITPALAFRQVSRQTLARAGALLLTLPLATTPALAQSITPAADGTNTIVNQQGNTFNITGGQTSSNGANLFQSFQQFGLNAGEVANFLANPQVQNILGRVGGGNPSVINGLIQVTGGNPNLYLMNPAGILFGPNASLNVPAAFTATTATGIGFGNNQWFNTLGNGNYANLVGNPTSFLFGLTQPGAIVNTGTLAVSPGQSLSLIGGTIVNTGTLSAPGGQITLAAVPGSANLVRLGQPGNPLSLEFQQAPIPIPASGITPATLPALLTGGNVGSATGLTVTPSGTVELTGSGITVPTGAGTTVVSGQVSVASNTPTPAAAIPQINIAGDRVALLNAQVDASSPTGGGTVQIGGGYQGQGTIPNARQTLVNPGSTIQANATVNGNGGHVIIWSDGTTQFYGDINIQGGPAGGNGGLAEVSGQQTLDYQGQVNAQAPQGQTGTLLLDPTNIFVTTGAGADFGGVADVDQFADPDLGPNYSNIDVALINGATANVILQATNNITFAAPVNITGFGVGLTAQAGSGIFVNQPIATQGGGVTLQAANAITVNGAITTNGGAVNLNGSNPLVAGAPATATITVTAPISTNGGLFNAAGSSFNSAGVDLNTGFFGNPAGAITITATNGGITTGNLLARPTNGFPSSGAGGTVTLTATNGDILTADIDTSSSYIGGGYGGGYGSGNAGPINLQAVGGSITTGNLNTSSLVSLNAFNASGTAGQGGAVNLNATGGVATGNITTNSTAQATSNPVNIVAAQAGGVTIVGGTTVTTGSIEAASIANTIGAASSGVTNSGSGGPIAVTGRGNVTTGAIDTRSVTQIGAGAGTSANGGSISLTSTGGSLQSTSLTSQSASQGGTAGAGGAINLTAATNITADSVIGGSSPGLTGNPIAINAPGIINLGTLDSSGANVLFGNLVGASRSLAILERAITEGGSFTAQTFNFSAGVPLLTARGNIQISSPGALLISANSLQSGGGAISLSGTSVDSSQTPLISGGSPISITASGGNIVTNTVDSAGGDITISTPSGTIQAGNLTSIGGDITIDAGVGSILAGDLNSSSNTGGGGIKLIAQTAITAGQLNSQAIVSGNGGNVFIDPLGDVQVQFINAQGSRTGQGGTVDITTQQFFRALGSFIASNGQSASISTQGGGGGGSVTIRHSGGALNTPFIVGNGSTNGTASAITSGTFAIDPTQSFPASFTRGNLALITQDPPPPPPPPPPSTNQPAPPQAGPVQQEPADLAFVGQPISLLGPDEARRILAEIERETGVPPAIIYVSFIPPEMTPPLESREAAQTQEVADHLGKQIGFERTIGIEPSPNDELELLLITPGSKPIRKRFSTITRGQVLGLSRKFVNEATDPRKTRTTSYLPAAQQLYSWLIQPLKADLEANKIQHISFILDQGIRFIPVAALHDGKQFLVEHYSLGLMPSLSLTDTRYVDVRKSQVLAMGASEFQTLPDLPAVPTELKAIESLWPSSAFINQAFTLNNLKAQRQQRPYGIVHLATHAEFRPGSLDNSFIQLWDTRLRLDQLRQLGWNRPPVDLVVLSACRTAFGDKDAELGFAGFALQAGVRSALAGLWYVSDEGTLALMSEFYNQLKEAPIRAEALRRAQVAMIKGQVRLESGQLRGVQENIPLPPALASRREINFSHPFYWAAFTLIGNPW